MDKNRRDKNRRNLNGLAVEPGTHPPAQGGFQSGRIESSAASPRAWTWWVSCRVGSPAPPRGEVLKDGRGGRCSRAIYVPSATPAPPVRPQRAAGGSGRGNYEGLGSSARASVSVSATITGLRDRVGRSPRLPKPRHAANGSQRTALAGLVRKSRANLTLIAFSSICRSQGK